MIRRTEIDFAIRTDDLPASEELVANLESAFSCSFTRGTFRKMPAMVAEVLGVTVSLTPWRGVGAKKIYRLHGDVLDDGFVAGVETEQLELDRIDVSAYVADLLNIRTPYRWYTPTSADLDAENEHARAVDRGYGD